MHRDQAKPTDPIDDPPPPHARSAGGGPKRARPAHPPRVVNVGGVEIDAAECHDPDAELGARYTPAATTFRVFAPTAESVEVILARRHTGGRVATRPLRTAGRGIWTAAVTGDHKGKYYAYRLAGPGLDPKREAGDIYATCAAGPGPRTLIVDPAETRPPGFDPTAFVQLGSPLDAVVYEAHVRDFTIAPTCGAQAAGQYRGFAEAGTHLPDDPSVPTGLDHLCELGITHVQLMPVQDFANGETSADPYNWGYMPVFHNSPDGWYASAADGPQRIREFRQLVQALHDRGIGVILDVVYNHADPTAAFDALAPGYYFRRRADGSYFNGSGCGNEFASELPMARKFILDSVRYWATEYGIDGFRFDLMGLIDRTTLLEIRDALRAINPSALIYGEPWVAAPSGLDAVTQKEHVAGTGIAAFNDCFRDAIKGDRDGGPPGFVQTGERIDRIRQGILAATNGWATEPADVVTYCECHDNLTTWDKLIQSAPGSTYHLKKRMQRFAGFLVLTAQGIPYLHAGQEFCRTKWGNRNSYNLPDAVNQLDWLLKRRSRDVFAYYRGLIALRRAHPALRLRSTAEIRERLTFADDTPSPRCLACTLDAAGLPDEPHAALLLLLNGDHRDHDFPLPAGTWQVLADDYRAGPQPLAELGNAARVKAHSGMLLAR